MSAAIAAIMVVAVVVIVGWPFLRRSRTNGRALGEHERIEGLRRARADVYHEIQQLESDRETGLVEDDDYRAELHDSRVAAARLLQSETASSAEAGVGRLERQVREARRRRARGGRAGGA